MVSAVDEIRRLAGAIPDPEMPALTIADLGILREVRIDRSGHVDVEITPTYSGCPALDTIREDVERCVRDHGYGDVTVHIVLSPAWTTDWMSEAGRVKLREYGIAPPRQHLLRCADPEDGGRMPAVQLVTHAGGESLRFDAMSGGAPV